MPFLMFDAYFINLAINLMLLKQYINNPQNHHFYRWYVYYSQSWVDNGIVLPTLFTIIDHH